MKMLLICAAGMSTGMLVKTIKEAASDMGVDLEITACAVSDLESHISDCDIVMLGPQVGYHIDKIRGKGHGIPVMVIDKMNYGMQDGAMILKSALAFIGADRQICSD